MRFDVVTLFPEMFADFLRASIIGRAARSGIVSVRFRSPREFGIGRHKSVDDTPYGGGSGMLMRVDVLVACMESLDADAPDSKRARRILLTPQGAPLHQSTFERLANEPAVMLVCGRYEGFDERVGKHVEEELSIGDFVLTGGELAAMVVVDGVSRLVPGVLGNDQSASHESHGQASGGRLEYPQYTRPQAFRGDEVPPELVSGNHAQIEQWRREQSEARTRQRRPDLAHAMAKKT